MKCSSDASMSMPQHVRLAVGTTSVLALAMESAAGGLCGVWVWVWVHCSMVGGEGVHHGGEGGGL